MFDYINQMVEAADGSIDAGNALIATIAVAVIGLVLIVARHIRSER